MFLPIVVEESKKHSVDYVDGDEYAVFTPPSKDEIGNFYDTIEKKIYLNEHELSRKPPPEEKGERVVAKRGKEMNELFQYPLEIKKFPPLLWNNMFHLLPELFLESVRYHKYISEIYIRYQPKNNLPLEQRSYSPVQDHISEAQEAGLISFSKKRISKEYMVLQFTFLNFKREDGEEEEESNNAIDGENLDRILDENEATSIIEDLLQVDIVVLFDPSQPFTEAKDERNVKYGCLFFSLRT